MRNLSRAFFCSLGLALVTAFVGCEEPTKSLTPAPLVVPATTPTPVVTPTTDMKPAETKPVDIKPVDTKPALEPPAATKTK